MRKMLLALAVIAMSAPAAAGPILVTNPGALAADGSIAWGTLGPAGTPVPSPFAIGVAGVPGLTATLALEGPGGLVFKRLDQLPGSGWAGNFGPSEELLWTSCNSDCSLGYGPVSFSFSSGIYGFGTQIQNNWMGEFVAHIWAYDAADNLLAHLSRGGNSTIDGDDSAIFIGVLSDTPNIRSVWLGTPDLHDFAISEVLVNAGNGVPAVPEPASMILLGTGLAGAAVRRFRRKA